MKKNILLLAAACLLTGCTWHPQEPVWIERFIPTTEAEHRAVADMEVHLVGTAPRVLSGHDQDWDDAIKASHNAALHACCRPTYWEKANVEEYHWEFTGRWRYAESH